MEEDQAFVPIDRRALKIPAGGTPTLIGGRCTECRKYFFPTRDLCPVCFDKGTVEEVALSNRATLVTYTIVRRALNRTVPYAMAYLRLPEGVMLFARLTDVDMDHLRFGMEMEAVFDEEEIEERKVMVYKYRPAGSGNGKGGSS
jgi:uncharacterized protein